jgi:hypothetical protein
MATHIFNKADVNSNPVDSSLYFSTIEDNDFGSKLPFG